MNAKSVVGTQTTWFDVVRMVFPTASDDEADYLLWERTCFPFGTTGQVMRQLRDERATR